MTPVLQPFTPQQLEQRRPVWLALADLYLDTDTRPNLPRLALTLAQSDLSEHELEVIWRREITPLLYTNGYSVAGVWGAWDEQWLEWQLLERGAGAASGWLPVVRALHRLRAGGIEPYFQTVLTLQRELLALPPPERVPRTALWSWLARAYFWPDSFGLLERPPDPNLYSLFLALEPQLRPLLTAQESADLHRLHVLPLIGDPS